MRKENFCFQCAGKLEGDVKYCPYCGAMVGFTTCQCGFIIPPQARYCPSCRRTVEEHKVVEMKKSGLIRYDPGYTWARGEDDICAFIEISDVEGIFSKGVLIPYGTEALLFEGGEYVMTLKSGNHTLQNLLDRIKGFSVKRAKRLFFYDASDIELTFSFQNLRSIKDGQEFTVHFNGVFRIMDSALFLRNFVKDRQSIRKEDLKKFLSSELRILFLEAMKRYMVSELCEDPGRRGELELELLSAWAKTLQRNGLKLEQIKIITIESPAVEDIYSLRRDSFKEGYIMDEKLSHRLREVQRMEREDEVIKREREEELKRMATEGDYLKRKIELYKKLMEQENLKKFAEASSEKDREKVLWDIDKDMLLLEEEKRQILLDLEIAKQRDEAAKTLFGKKLMHLIAMDEMRFAYDQKLQEIQMDSKITESQRQDEMKAFLLELQKKDLAHQQAIKEERERIANLLQKQKGDLEMAKEWNTFCQQLEEKEKEMEHRHKIEEERLRIEEEEKILKLKTGMTPEQLRILAQEEAVRQDAPPETILAIGSDARIQIQLMERIIQEIKTQQTIQRADMQKIIEQFIAKDIAQAKAEVEVQRGHTADIKEIVIASSQPLRQMSCPNCGFILSTPLSQCPKCHHNLS